MNLSNFPLTVTELRQQLQLLENLGHGNSEIHVMQYAGGDDEPCYLRPVPPETLGDPVVFETLFVKD